jgi:hypothetical protein
VFCCEPLVSGLVAAVGCVASRVELSPYVCVVRVKGRSLRRRVNAVVGKERNTVADESTDPNYIIPL